MPDMRLAALQYIQELGLPVFPVHSIKDGRCTCGKPDCESIGKHPRTKKGCSDASYDVEVVERWWRQWPDANIGLATGSRGGIIVIDIDLKPERDGMASLATLCEEYGALPETWTARTGSGGVHYVYRKPENATIRNKVNLAPGVDVRGEGGYIVAAPSLHASGRRYSWDAERRPLIVDLAALPPAWVEFLSAGSADKAPAQGGGYVRQELPSTFTQGERNEMLFKLGAALRAKELSAASIEAALITENRTRCAPPLEDSEVRAIAASCGRYPAGTSIPSSGRSGGVGVEVRGNSGSHDSDVGMEADSSDGQYDVGSDEESEIYLRYPDMPVKGLRMPRTWGFNPVGGILENKVNAKLEPVIIQTCPHPIFPVERFTNLDTGIEKIRLLYKRDRMWKDIIVSKTTIADKPKITSLADQGVQVTSETAKALVNYLSAFETENRNTLPLQKSLSRCGWINTRHFAPYTDDVTFDGDQSYKGVYECLKPRGDKGKWLETVKAACQSNILAAMFAASCAAPLVWACKAQPFFLHVWGDSGVGKSVGTMMGLSLWGAPEKLWKKFNSTTVFMERHAAFCHSIPACFDELQAVDSRKVSLGQIIYTLGQGKSRGRGQRSGGVEVEQEWHTVFITTGEVPVTVEASKGGERNRVIELKMREGDYPEGVSAPTLATFVSDNYGHFGQPYVEALINEMGGVHKPLMDAYTRMVEALQHDDHTGKHVAFTAMLALGRYYGWRFIFGELDFEAWDGAVALGKWILGQLETKQEVDPIPRAWEFLQGWIWSNGDKFKEDAYPLRYGYRDPGEVCIVPIYASTALKEAGFTPEQVLPGFAERGWIKGQLEGNRLRYSVKKMHNGTSQRVIVVPAGRFGEVNEEAPF